MIVLGGGLAGMAAACELLRHHHTVTLVERRPYLGGRTYSFIDRETGCQVDNGQHVFVGCFTHYIDFLKQLGVFHKAALQRSLRITVLSREGRKGHLSTSPLPAPLHLLPSFLLYPHISLKERLRVIPALIRIWRTDRQKHSELEGQTLYQWLRRHGQSERAIDHFWNLIILPTLNDDIRDVSADMGFMIFQEGLLRSRNAANMGYSRVGLSELMGDAAKEHIQRRGGQLLLNRSVKSILVTDQRVSGVALSDGSKLTADAYISALPFDALLSALPEAQQRDPFFAPAATLQWSPIVALHIWYDRPVADFDFAAFVGSPVQWVFNKSLIYGQDGPGQYLCVSLSGAWEHWPQSKQALYNTFVPELAHLLPNAQDAIIKRFVVVKSQKATFRSVPGAQAGRLPVKTPISNLFLAGEWTETGWPSTMESAVRSGHQAARLAMDQGAS